MRRLANALWWRALMGPPDTAWVVLPSISNEWMATVHSGASGIGATACVYRSAHTSPGLPAHSSIGHPTWSSTLNNSKIKEAHRPPGAIPGVARQQINLLQVGLGPGEAAGTD